MNNKKGGNSIPLEGTAIDSPPLVLPLKTYGYKYGGTTKENAVGFLNHTAGQQNRLNNAHRGGNQILEIGCSTPDNVLTVPKFSEINPSGPNGYNSSSKKSSGVHAETITNKEYDHYAYITGGYTKKSKRQSLRKSKRPRRRSLRKSKRPRRRSLRKFRRG